MWDPWECLTVGTFLIEDGGRCYEVGTDENKSKSVNVCDPSQH